MAVPEISVIVPIYKVEKYLCRCIDSILAQTYTDFELILVDDGSPDNCGNICDEYAKKDQRIRVIHKKNGGVSSARNSALEVACGEYLTFCDSDDSYSPEWLSNLKDTIIQYSADVVVGNYCKISESNICDKISEHEVGIYELPLMRDKIQYCFVQIFGHKHGWEVWSRLFRASIVKENGIRFCETCENFAEDLGFVLEYAMYAKRVVSIQESGYNYLTRSGSMMDLTNGVVKLNAANEVSLHLADRYKGLLKKEKEAIILPIFHFLVMSYEYRKVIWNNQYSNLSEMLKDIKRYNEWKDYTKQIFKCYRQLKEFFGIYTARRILLLSHYCLHGNWRRFTMESMLLYRFNKPDAEKNGGKNDVRN